MYKAARNTQPLYDASNSHAFGIEDENIEVCWLPSLPLTHKHKAPPIKGLGILYSEELEEVLQVFETSNLCEDIKKFSYGQAIALNIDPACRLHWLEISNPERTYSLKHSLQARVRSRVKSVQ